MQYAIENVSNKNMNQLPMHQQKFAFDSYHKTQIILTKFLLFPIFHISMNFDSDKLLKLK